MKCANAVDSGCDIIRWYFETIKILYIGAVSLLDASNIVQDGNIATMGAIFGFSGDIHFNNHTFITKYHHQLFFVPKCEKKQFENTFQI